MSKRAHHVHLIEHGFYDGHLTIDGEPFPFDIRSVRYRLDSGSVPTITVEFEADKITIEHTAPETTVDRAWDDHVNAAFRAAEDGEAFVLDGRHADAMIRIVVFPDSQKAAQESA